MHNEKWKHIQQPWRHRSLFYHIGSKVRGWQCTFQLIISTYIVKITRGGWTKEQLPEIQLHQREIHQKKKPYRWNSTTGYVWVEKNILFIHKSSVITYTLSYKYLYLKNTQLQSNWTLSSLNVHQNQSCLVWLYCLGRIPRLSLIRHSLYVRVVEKPPPPPLTGEQYGKMELKYPEGGHCQCFTFSGFF